jgi:tRNA dimethylallyltransferase
MSRPALICLLGPTASGKTELAVAIAERHNCELISVDSALVYRGLDIGSAKPDYPHRLVDIRDPLQPYSVAEFCRDARLAIAEIVAAGKTPLLVGGTMLYFKALLEGLADMPVANPAIRRQLELEAAASSWPAMHERLAAVDPVAAKRIHPNHSQRLARALEVYLSSGVTMTEWLERQQGEDGGSLDGSYAVLQIAMTPARRALLHARIEKRLQLMVEMGLVEEVRGLYQRGDLHQDLPAVRAVGYRQMWAHVKGEYELERAIELAQIATRQLAKRQLTWLRGWPGLNWIYTNEAGFAADCPENLESSRDTALELALKYVATVAM